MKIYTLQITPYKEKDAIILAINDKECFSFLAKGVLTMKSRFAYLNNPLMKIDAIFVDGNYKYPLLKSADLLFSSRKENENLDYLKALMLINEVNKKLVNDEDKYKLYPLLDETLPLIKIDKNINCCLLYYLLNILSINGMSFEVRHCVFCESKKDIVSFSFIDGGFICRNCLEKNVSSDLNINQMKIIYNFLLIKDLKTLLEKNYEEKDIFYILNQIFIYIDDAFGITLMTKKLF